MTVLAFWTLGLQGGATAAPDPTEQMKPFLDNIITQLKSEEFQNDTTCNQCNRIVELASEHFDFREMSKRVMGKQWKHLTPQQQDQFTELFTKLLQYAYIGQVNEYVDKKIEFTGQRIKGNRAEVKTKLMDENKEIPVSYIMILKGDNWMTYDIIVEGVSLVRNYREQIFSVLREEQFAGLITLLEKKIANLEAGNDEG